MVRFTSTLAVSLLYSAISANAFVPSSSASLKAFSATKSIIENNNHNAAISTANSNTQLCDMLTQTELPEKIYFKKDKEAPKVLGGIQIGLRKLVVVTGASSGLGRECAKTLAKTGKYFVVMAVRDVEKGKKGE